MTTDTDTDVFLTHEMLPPPLRKLHPRTVRRLASEGKLGDTRPITFSERGGTFYSRDAILAFMASRLEAAQ